MSSHRLQDALPEFAQELEELLRASKEPELAGQVPHLWIARRCDYEDDFCSTFYVSIDRLAEHVTDVHCVALEPKHGLIVVDVASNRITGVEVLFRDEIRSRIRALLP